MLRHSISQVFGYKHPALSPRENDDIRQPRFIQSSSATTIPFPAQRSQQAPNVASSNVSYLNSPIQSSSFEEAAPMPPTPMLAPMPNPAIQAIPLPGHMPAAYSSPPTIASQRDASNIHPVFFTERLRRSPFILDAVAITSPVAYGYDCHNTQRRADGTMQAML